MSSPAAYIQSQNISDSAKASTVDAVAETDNTAAVFGRIQPPQVLVSNSSPVPLDQAGPTALAVNLTAPTALPTVYVSILHFISNLLLLL